jgi:hypothetical protein
MADLKISQLNPATTPLAGTEVLPIVQSGNTVKVSVSDLTAARAVSTGAVTASGNLRAQYSSGGNVSVIANNAASTAGATSQLIGLNDASRGLRIQYSSSGGFGGSALINGVTTEAGQIFTDNGYPLLLGVGGFAASIFDTSLNQTLVNGNLVLGTAGKGIQFANTTWLETVVASYRKSSSTTVAAGTGRSDLYFSVAANQTFTVTATGLGGLATIVYGSAGEACTFFWSWNTATINILGNGGTMFAATSTPSATQFGIYKSANSSVLSFKTGTSFSPGNVSVCLIGDYAASTTDPV